MENVTGFGDTHEHLTPAELDRASAFVFEPDRRRFIARRSLVKCLLAALHDCEPTDLAFNVNPYGKPALASGPYVFNTSSSGDSLLVALGRRSAVGEIGVDLETLRPMPDALSIARHFFATDEAAQLGSLTGDELQRAFFNCWTRKEALVKALGSGMSFGLDRFSVSLLPHEPVGIRRLDGQASTWHLHGWSPSPRHIAALATQFAPTEVRLHGLRPGTALVAPRVGLAPTPDELRPL